MVNFEKYFLQTKFLFFLFFAFLFFECFSQTQKFNPYLIRKYYKSQNEFFNLLVKGNLDSIKKDLSSSDQKFIYSSGDIASVKVNTKTLSKWIIAKYIYQIEYLPAALKILDDTTTIKSNFLPVYSGTSPLPNSLSGKNVVVGIIDTGIDLDHPDFLDTSGKSRVLFVWDQRVVGISGAPSSFGYGQEWSKSQIDSGFCNHQDNSYYGHGSRVSGIAVGNGNSNPIYRGVAFESDIVAVAVDFNSPGPTVTDAVYYVFEKASQLNKPAVINLSLGDYLGSHDATDLQAQLIDNIIGNGINKAVIAAAGNAGQIPFHLGYTVNSDTSFTWFSNNQSNQNFQLFADTGNFSQVSFSIAVHDPITFQKIDQTSFFHITNVLGTLTEDTLFSLGNRIGSVSIVASLSDSLFTIDFSTSLDSINYLWSLETTGNGRFDSWNFDFKYSGLPTSIQYPRIIYYKRPDTLMTICSSFQCSKKVITVGNFLGRNTIYNLNNSVYSFGGIIDSIAPSSSLGPTRNSIVKPDVSAPGENIITTIPMRFKSWFISNFPFVVTTDSFHTKFDGTSASAPIVAGLAALYFQLNPGASSLDLIDHIHQCSYFDSFTGSTPNYRWGYGKLDAFSTLVCNFNTVSITEYNEPTINIFPNPTNEVLNINLPFDFRNCTILISNSLGQVVCSTQANGFEAKIDFSGFNSGIYFFTFKGNDTVPATYKVIKQ